jgi:glycerol-3-phosphate dehydrogenase
MPGAARLTSPRICVVGGGINGAGIAWELARKGYEVTLFEKNRFGGATSSSTTKMIHGGLRYLETGSFRLVRESLRERAFLLEALPDVVKPIRIVIPVYRSSPRSALTLRLGLTLYDLLAGRRRIGRHQRHDSREIASQLKLKGEGLRSILSYWDAQVDDHDLVQRVIAAARRDGAEAHEQCPVTRLEWERHQWSVSAGGTDRSFDYLVNAVGPWMNEYLRQHALPTRYRLTLLRGSHVVLDRPAMKAGVLIQSSEGRVLFVLPWKGATLVGTTEAVHESMREPVTATPEEVSYLLERFNHYFAEPASEREVTETFAGVRPLIESRANPSKISREYKIEISGSMINVFGGKMTTFMALSRRVGRAVDRLAGARRAARPPIFTEDYQNASGEQR